MAGRKPSVTTGPFIDLLAEHGLTPKELAEQIRVGVDKIYKLADGRLKKGNSVYVAAIAARLSIRDETVTAIIEEQRRAHALSQFARAVAAVAKFLSENKRPGAANATAYGPTRKTLRQVVQLGQEWLAQGYRRPASKIKPLLLRRNKK